MGLTILTPSAIASLVPQEGVLRQALTSLGYRGPLQDPSGGMSIHVINALLLLISGRTLKLPIAEYDFLDCGPDDTIPPLIFSDPREFRISRDLFTTFWSLSEACTHPLASQGREEFLRGVVGQRPELFLGGGDQPITQYTPEELLDSLQRLRGLVGLDRNDPWNSVFEGVYRAVVGTAQLSEAALAPEIGALLSHPREWDYAMLLQTVDHHYHRDLVRRVIERNERSGSAPVGIRRFGPLTKAQQRWLSDHYNGQFPLQAETAVLFNFGGDTIDFQTFLLGIPQEKTFPFHLFDLTNPGRRDAMQNSLRSLGLERRRRSVGMMIFLQLAQIYEILQSHPGLLAPGAAYFGVREGMVGVFREELKARRVPIRVLVPETHPVDVPILQWARHPQIDVCLLPAGRTGEDNQALAARWMEKALAGIHRMHLVE